MDRLAITRYVEADVRCLMCGEAAGVLRRELAAHRTAALFQQSAGGPRWPIVKLAELRCARCGGSLYMDEFRARKAEPLFDPSIERPQRGRPPNRVAG